MARGPAPLLSQGLDERRPPPPPPLSEGLYPPLLLRQRVEQKHIRYVAIHFQDQRDAAWLRYRTCAEITV